MFVKLDTKTGALIIAAAAILVVIFILAFVARNSGVPPTGQQPKSPTGVSPTYAPKGKLVAGFPKELILDNAARVSNSYSINYSASLNQYTAEWNSSSSMVTLYASYKEYLSKHGWRIVNQNTRNASWRGVYATNGTHDANVAIVSKGSGAQVIISYVAK